MEKLRDILEGTRCWKGYEKKGTKKLFGKTVPNCVKKEEIELTDIEENLRNWVKQKWVDISRKKINEYVAP